MRESAQKSETHPSSQQLRSLLEIAEGIFSNRELSSLLKNLAGLLHRIVRFDHLWLNLYLRPLPLATANNSSRR